MKPRALRSAYDDAVLLSELIGLVYDAAAAPDLWSSFLDRTTSALDLRAATFTLTAKGPDGALGSIPLATGLDDSAVAAYAEHFAATNPFRAPLLALPTGSVLGSGEIVSDDELMRTEFFAGFYAPAGLRHGVIAIIRNDPDAASMWIGHRAPEQARSSDADLELVRMLTPHLQRARILAVRLGTLSSHERMVSSVLDRLLVGLIFVDASGGFLHANARGEEILHEQDGLGLAQGRIVTGRIADTRALDAIVATACEVGQGRSHAAPTSLRIARPSARRDLEVMACPVDPRSEMWGDGRAAAFLVVNDGEPELRGAERRLRELYGLSKAESKLAVALANGATVKDWARERGVSVETARWQLKQIFGKTGVSRQPDLLRLVLLGPALVR